MTAQWAVRAELTEARGGLRASPSAPANVEDVAEGRVADAYTSLHQIRVKYGL